MPHIFSFIVETSGGMVSQRVNVFIMKSQMKYFFFLTLLLIIGACSTTKVQFLEEDIDVVNREITSIDKKTNTIMLNNKESDGLAIIEGEEFTTGTIEVDIKGEDLQGRSFVGVAFNIQNDSTYEAVYFRPFNFLSDEEVRRMHSVQYIYHPTYTWRYLRTNNEGEYEADFPRRPDPNDWFTVRLKIDDDKVQVYDVSTDTLLLTVERLTKQVSGKIALWIGFNSKGAFRNLSLKK